MTVSEKGGNRKRDASNTILGGNKMTTATAEKPTCKYSTTDGYSHTQCGQVEVADVTKHYTYCPDCGGKIKRVEKNG